ncbi:MAG TPA: hypothetical protein VF254_09195 [Gammaproteobacteria bacterium]
MNKGQRTASRIFLFAGIYGIVALLPQYFLETRIGVDYPPPITHPEHFYGFIGVALAWQFAFLVIARDVVRYRLLMLPAMAEKLAFGIPAWVLFIEDRAATAVAVAGSVDLALAALFGLAFHFARADRKNDAPPVASRGVQGRAR